MAKENPQVAVVGTGYWGKNLVRNFHALGALRTICDTDRPTLESFLGKFPETIGASSLVEVLGDREVDGVVVATPAETHAALVRESLLAGKDVYVEKPLCLSAEEGRRLVDLAAQKDRVLMVGHLLWYHPVVRKLQDLIEAGALGKILYVYSNRLNLGKLRREENVLWSFAPHDISLIIGLLGEMPDRVQAQGGNYLHQAVADVTVSTLSFPSGVRAHLFVSWLHPIKEQKLVVVGQEKMAVFDDTASWPEKLKLFAHTIEWPGNVPVAHRAEAELIEVEQDEPLRLECRRFLECIRAREKPRTDGAEAVRVLQVLNACQKALETGRPVPVAGAGLRAEEEAGSFVHETAVIDEGVEIGPGAKIWHFTHVLPGSRIGPGCNIGQNVVIGPRVTIGRGCKVQNNVSVYEGVTLEDDVFCGPSMVFTNVFNPRSHIKRMKELRPTLVRRGATIGANATIVCGHTLGEYCFIGAGAVVTRDVPAYALMAGNPAEQKGWMCACGVRLLSDLTCPTCQARYREAGGGLAPLSQGGTESDHPLY
ncbi:MAG: Gfo/Idh/MocA family oxidoreductase [Thermodesulfobacteriota bacterium]